MKLNIENNLSTNSIWYLTYAFCMVALILFMPEFSYAEATGTSESALSGTLCRVQQLLTGTLGKSIASIAVVVLGIGLFLGKLSWGLAIATACGIGLIFGASNIVGWLGGITVSTCVTNTGS